MSEVNHELEAVKIAGEWNKQLSLWATGSIVLGGSDVSTCSKVLLIISWVTLAASILVGNFAYGAPLTGAGKTVGWKLCLNDATRKLSIAQSCLFVGGIGFLIWFAALNIPRHLPGPK
jgi:hypothetical protein